MKELKLPVRAKVIEALTAVLDGRVRLLEERRALVGSSDGTKQYTVTWSEDGVAWKSSDPATVFQSTIGYPIIAVMIRTGRLTADLELAAPLRGIPWKELNDRFRRDYEAAVTFALSDLTADNRGQILAMADAVLRQVASFHLVKG
jgi:hypothetical protein